MRVTLFGQFYIKVVSGKERSRKYICNCCVLYPCRRLFS